MPGDGEMYIVSNSNFPQVSPTRYATCQASRTADLELQTNIDFVEPAKVLVQFSIQVQMKQNPGIFQLQEGMKRMRDRGSSIPYPNL